MATTKTVEKKKEVPFNIISFLFFPNTTTGQPSETTNQPPPTNLFSSISRRARHLLLAAQHTLFFSSQNSFLK
jgi:hypothetical protein